ncbi:MAG: aldo/keto reductase [Anaerolineaceae bacterium]|nr:aldo/keto reductase [Anaerolineaceae bacterium]
MKTRKFGKTGLEVSPLGFGCMRLPVINEDSTKINEPEAIKMIRWAIDNGVNYVDTAYPYHGGNSELLVAKALKDGYREKVTLATKLPCGRVETGDDFDRFLNEQLGKLEVDHIDAYMMHGINHVSWTKMKELGILDWLQKHKGDDRVRLIGFSFHDEYEFFEEIINDYDGWDFCQIQYNYMDITEQAGLKGLKLAAEKGLAVVIMEPLLGGKLANLPEKISQAMTDYDSERSQVDWALNWLWDQPEVSVVLSGMSTMEQIVEDVELAAKAKIGTMSEEEKVIINQVRDTFHNLIPIHCTFCEYCLPCPHGVFIPRIFEHYNRAVMFDNWGVGRIFYKMMPEDSTAPNCVECGECEEACPQGLDIIEWLKVCENVMGETKADYDTTQHPEH